MKITVKPKFQSPFAWTIVLAYFVGAFAVHAEISSPKRPPNSSEQFRITQANPSSPANNPTPPAPAPIVVMPFDDALISAATTLLSQVSGSDSASRIIVVDPLIDGMSGFQSNATRTMESLITELIRYKYPQLSVQKFTSAAVTKSPTVLVGTFTSVNKQEQTTGTREAYLCFLCMADYKSAIVYAKVTTSSALQ